MRWFAAKHTTIVFVIKQSMLNIRSRGFDRAQHWYKVEYVNQI